MVTIGDCKLICADCREVLPTIPSGMVAAAVTDPPYGVDFEYASHEDDLAGWKALMTECVPQMRRIAPFVVLPSCAINRLPWWYAHFPPDWLIVWHKGSPGHQAKVGFNAWESLIVYGRPKKPMHDYFSVRCGFDENGHPCPKPVAWALWLVVRAAVAGTVVLDPFMGSGTIGVACARLGRKYIGIEKDRVYFEIACARITKAVNDQKMQLRSEPKEISVGLF